MNKRHVGITGFMTRAEVDAALAALPPGLTLMIGVLVSEKTLRGERNRWWRRYPRVEDIAGIFSDDPRCLNLIHYCADEPPSWEVLCKLVDAGGLELDGFQFNGAYPDEYTLRALKDAWPTYYGDKKRPPGATVVLQVRPDGGPGTMDRLRDTIDAMPDCDVHVLIDGSGGRGIPIHPDVADAWGMMIRGHFGNDVGLAFAGGLDADYLPRIAAEVRSYGASIDAEGRLRDGDEGGDLNMEKVQAYLAAAGELLGERG
jgi:hypothetical protein